MSILRKTLPILACIGILAGNHAIAARGDVVEPYSPGATNEQKICVWENSSSNAATLTIIDSFAPIGHAFITDLSTGGLIQDLCSKKDSFSLPAGKKVGLFFIPTAKALGLTFQVSVGSDTLNFNLKKQYVTSTMGKPMFNNKPGGGAPSPTSRISIQADGFESPMVPFITCHD